MKKLLSLLSILTISGTAIPTTIAASSYEKQEKLNSDINSKTNNSENLNRSKRQNNNNITPDVKVSYEINDYFSDLYNAINFLQNNDNIRLITPQETGGFSSPSIFYVNENFNNQYFIMSINIENDRRISLIFRSSDFYLQGFIGHPTFNNQTLNVYYYFNDSTITNVSDTTSSQRMPFGSNYTGSNGLRADERAPIRWTGIVDAFHQLANYGENPSFVDINTLRSSFVRVILATAESMRFRAVRNNIISNNDNDTSTSNWGWYFNNFLRNWDRISQEALNYLIQLGTLIGFNQLQNINIFSKTLSKNFKTCNGRNARDLNNNNEYCPILERVFYHKEDKSPLVFKTGWKTKMNVNISGEIDLGDVNPLNYKKIDFLGDDSNLYTKISWGNTPYYGKSIKDFFNERNNSFHDIIVDSGSINPAIGQIQFEKQKELIKISDKQGLASFEGNIKFGLSFYWKNNHFYLRIPVTFYAETWISFSGGEVWAGLGNGIKFYN